MFFLFFFKLFIDDKITYLEYIMLFFFLLRYVCMDQGYNYRGRYRRQIHPWDFFSYNSCGKIQIYRLYTYKSKKKTKKSLTDCQLNPRKLETPL